MTAEKNYDSEGRRVTNCCKAFSTYDEHGVLFCKACFKDVALGEGDGSDDLDFHPNQIHRRIHPSR